MNLTRPELQVIRDMGADAAKAWIQEKALSNWVAAGRRGTFEGATGVGKSKVAIDAIDMQLGRDPDSLIYIAVPTETLRDKTWPDEFRKWGKEDLLSSVRIICHSSIGKERPGRDVDLFVFDEIHHITPQSAQFFSSVDWRVFYILGLTAILPKNFWDADKEKLGIINRLCPTCFNVTLEEAVFLRLVSDFNITVLMFDLDRTDHYVVGGTKKKPQKMTEYTQYQYLTKKLQKATYSNNAVFKFVWIQKRVQFLYNLRTRAWIVEDVFKQIKDKGKTLLFFGSINMCEQICGENVYHSKTTSEKLDAYRDDEIPYLGAVQALNEGENIGLLDQAIIAQINSKEIGIIQRIGRMIRYRADYVANIIILVARGTADEKWFKSATENFDKSRIKLYNIKPIDRGTTKPA